MSKYKTADAFVSILKEHGVDRAFINPGGDFLEVLPSMAAARLADSNSPQMILCLDESVTASAAYGNYMVTGKPQVIMVHSEVGTLQLGGHYQNLQWGRVPVVILSGWWNQFDEPRKTWEGKPYDQASIVRNNVKYDRYVKYGEDLHEVMAEAFKIACTEPTGPVYLWFPIDYLTGEIEKPEGPPAVLKPDPLPAVDMATLEKIANILLDARNPMLVSGNAGRFPQNVASLVSLAEALCAPVQTGYSWMNFPSNHPLCIGIEHILGSRNMDAVYDDADVILVIDYDVPYLAAAPPPKPETKLIQIDVDPCTAGGRLLWGRGADIFMKADSREAIPALEKLLKDKISAEKKAELDDRFRKISALNEKTRQGWYESALNQSKSEPISADYLCHCINQVIDEDTIVVNHTLTHCASPTEQIVRTKPRTWFGCPSGAIGWAPGAALGASSASPGKTVVAIMSDGGFIWGCPTSVIWTSARYHYPFLAVICNNRGYGAVREPILKMIEKPNPGDEFLDEMAVEFQPDYVMIAKGAGAGYGRIVTKPEEILPALKEAIEAVRSGKTAVLDVHLPRICGW